VVACAVVIAPDPAGDSRKVCLIRKLLLLVVCLGSSLGSLLASGTSTRLSGREIIRGLNPGKMVQTVRQNYREGRFYATDLTTHPTIKAALTRSMAPIDMGANVRATVWNHIHPLKIVASIADPIGLELVRQISSGEGLDFKKLLSALHPTIVGTTMVGAAAGDLAGAVIQSALAGLGPVGAGIGFFLKPALGFGGQVLGYNVGKGIVDGKGFKGAMASAIREIQPGRDVGQLLGGVIGMTLGQVLIPIPIVGGMIGGTLLGVLGAVVGSFLGKHGITASLNNVIRGWLGRLADRLDGGVSDPTPPAEAPDSTLAAAPVAFQDPIEGSAGVIDTPADPDDINMDGLEFE